MLILAIALVAASATDAVVVAGDAFLAAPRTPDLVRRIDEPGLAVVNFEGSRCRGPAGGVFIEGRWRLCVYPDAAAQLAGWGAGLVVHENNHARDGGDEGRRQLERDLEQSGLVIVDRARPRCLGREGRRLCVFAWHDEEIAALSAVVEAVRRHEADRVVVVVHKSRAPHGRPRGAAELVAAGADVVVGIGGHRPGRVEKMGPALVLHDLGDLVMDCACSRSDVGLLAVIPMAPEAPVRLRVVRVAHRPGDVVGAAPPPGEIERVLHDVRSRSPGVGALLVDDELLIPPGP